MRWASWIRNWKCSLERRWALYQALRRKAASRRLATRPRLEVLEDRWLLSTYTVISGGDSGTGTLRDAINQVNLGKYNQIDFNIGAVGSAQTITITSPLPALTANGVYIDGQIQGGSSNPTPLITLDGSGAGSSSDGLLLQGSYCTVSGLIIEHFSQNGIEVAGSNNRIGGVDVGGFLAGNILAGNTLDGVLIDSKASSTQVETDHIGVDSSGAALANGNGVVVAGSNNGITGNLISGNKSDGMYLLSGASGNYVEGNEIGTDLSGEAAISNSVGVEIAGAANVIESNTISGNSRDGVLLDSAASNNDLAQNVIGTNGLGAKALANGVGIDVYSSNNTIGGTIPPARNLISGNSTDGVLIESSASGNQVLGNFIGVGIYGTDGLANSIGIEIAGSSNTIGSGSMAGPPNVISGNSGDGVQIGSGVSGTLVQGNYIGTDPTGTKAVANGAGVEVSGSNNTIGTGNLISGNTGDGVLIDSGVSGVVVQGNLIGTDNGGAAALGNSGNGVEVAGNNNTIGGLNDIFFRSVISGNSGDGVKLDSGSSGNQVLGSFIGTNAAGVAALANEAGIEDGGSSNTIGGILPAGDLDTYNVISGNSTDGVLIDSGAKNETMGSNYIGWGFIPIPIANGTNGVEIKGTGNTIGNSGVSEFVANDIADNIYGDGVKIDSGASGNLVLGDLIGGRNSIGILVSSSNNTIGGSVAGAANVISGNSGDGVDIASGISGILVLGNYIGTDPTGTKAIANGFGVEVSGSNNTIGSSVYAGRNLISGNTGDGVKIDSGASGNQVLGNAIGVNVYDSAALGNSIGIEVAGSNNTLGASWAVAPNEISGNSGDGVKLDSGSSGNQVLGSYIGTNLAGTAAFANGVGIEDGGSGNTIGGSVLGDRNVISGNTGDGVLIDSSATNETMEGNYIGTDYSASTSIANGSNGVEIQGSGNTIGGQLTSSLIRNYISGNDKGDGVLIDSGASGNQVLGNFIGVDASGTIGLANSIGVEIAGNSNTVGGPGSGYTNVISGNSSDGVLVDSTGAGNVIQSNYVGTDYTGRNSLANSGSGIEIQGSGNTVGAGNVLSGNSADGLLIDSPASGNLVLGSLIGLNLSGAGSNGGNGVNIAGNNNTVGGTVTAALNIISGNSADGVLIASGASGNQVLGDWIGTNYYGTAAAANSIGVEVAGNSNTVGGAAGSGNVISGNSGDGVMIDKGVNGTQVMGNTIGVNFYDGGALANSGNGIEVAGSNNTLGASGAVAPNEISGNSGDGVKLDSGSSGNVVLGSYIGTNELGTAALANSIGIEVAGSGNTIGGTTSGERNVISGNSADGVLIDSGASGVGVLGNYIGTDATGTTAVGNFNGVYVSGSNNTIGGTVTGALNLISGNTASGVYIGSTGVLVQGNYIGTDITGTKAVANGQGIGVYDSNSTIGGTVSAARNIISGNTNDGLVIDDSGVIVQGNYIGTDVTGTKAVANSAGIVDTFDNNTIGGTTAGSGNLISGNSGDGVLISSAASGVLVLANNIGTNSGGIAAVGNSIGIEVAGSNNTLGASWAVAPNVISGNTSDGVLLDGGSNGNQVLGSYIGTNNAGTAAVANRIGIEDGGNSNTIGGNLLGARNVISGNSSDGVLIDSTATNETMWGNYIGTDYSASTVLANGANGVEIKGTSNTIGGNAGANYFNRNFISGNNNGDGVLIDRGASGNQVQGNFIGVGIFGTNGVANSVGVEIGGSSNTVGGASAGYTNVISGNSGDGVLVDSSGAGNVIQSNYVGTDYTGRAPLAKSGSGVEIQGIGNTVGAGNVLSGNSADGVTIDSTASGNLVQGSLIGLNLSGAGSNGGNGVNIAGNNNTVGGTVTAALNIISGNTADGVRIASGASGNQVLGDWIGTNYYGTAAAANSIGVEVAGNSNTVGGAAGSGNVISGNKGDGVMIDKGVNGTQVMGNTIGVNFYDGGALANSGNGIEVAGSNNTLGASYAVAFNEISGNSGDGVKLGSGSSGNVVLGSYIGTDHTGTKAFANSVGIEDGGSGNTIGGSVLGDRNVISGNSGDGVLIDKTATNETMLGNYIGTDYSNSVSLANGTNGVEIQGSGNTIGGLLVSSLVRNLIDGNSKGAGVKIDNGAAGNQVLGNFIGVNVSGTVGLANSIGVEVSGSGNTIGGLTNTYTNVISGNSGDGVLVDSTGASNFIESSFVGTDYTGRAALGNSGSGIAIAGNNNTVYAGNVIAYNSNNGVLVSAGSGNMIRQNSIYANSGLGISLASGANNNIVAPTISTATLSSGTLSVTGTFTATVGDTYVLEFFANPSGDAEGKIFLGSLPVTATSTTQGFTFTTTNTSQLGTYPDITATLTDNFGVGDTSEFSNAVPVSPVVVG